MKRCNSNIAKTIEASSEIKKELFRKTIHMMSALIPLFVYLTSKHMVLFSLGVIAILYAISEFFRCRGRQVKIISRIVEVANRKDVIMRFSLGPITLSLGAMITLYFFPIYIATIAIFSLSFGDGVASLIGKMFGKRQLIFEGKTCAGSLGCFVATFIAEFLFTHSLSLSLFVAFFTALIELFPLKDFDNLLIPILVAILTKWYLFFFPLF